MAGIDYTIPGQIKPFQLESPMNAMAQAMQLRGLQDTLQMNALKAQEYQQQQQEKNALARLMGSGIPYGSDEFFNRLSNEAPSYVEPIASSLEKRRKSESERETALLTRQKREQEKDEAARKTKEARRGAALRSIASATTPDSAYAMMQHYYGQGDLGYDDYQLLAPELLENPDWRATQTNILTRLLPAKEALTAGFDIEKAALDVDKAKQDFAKAKFGFTTEQIDTRRKQFDQIYPAISIASEADVEARIRAQAEDPILGPLIKQFGSVEQLIARDKAEFKNNAPGYKARLSGVPTADILKAAEERERAAFSQDQLNRVLNKQPLISIDQWRATQRPAQAAPAPAAVAAPDVAAAPRYAEVQGFGKNVPASDSASMASMAPAVAVDAKTVAMPTEAAVTTADGDKTLSAVPVVKDVYGVDFLDPTAQALYTLASNPEFKDSAPALRDMADKMQAEFVARGAEKRKEGQLTGTFENVVNSRKLIQALKKKPNLTEDEKELINTLEDQIKAAQTGFPPAPARPPQPTEITRKEAELADLDDRIRNEKDPEKLKQLKDQRKRLKADINADVYGRPSVVMQGPPPTDTTLDMLAAAYIERETSINSVPKALRMSVMNRAAEMLGKRGLSGEDAGRTLIESRIEAKTREATVRDFKVGKAALATRSFNTAIDHLETMDKLAAALQNNDTRLFNQIGNFFSKQVGASPITNFEAAKSIVGGEVAKALTGSNMALADRLEIRDAIIAASSPAQLRGVLKTFKQLLAGQLNSLRIQYQTGTGRDDFETKLSPASKRELNALNPQRTNAPRQMSVQDKQALKWANANPTDPRAAAIKKRLGVAQ